MTYQIEDLCILFPMLPSLTYFKFEVKFYNHFTKDYRNRVSWVRSFYDPYYQRIENFKKVKCEWCRKTWNQYFPWKLITAHKVGTYLRSVRALQQDHIYLLRQKKKKAFFFPFVRPMICSLYLVVFCVLFPVLCCRESSSYPQRQLVTSWGKSWS